MYSGYKSFVRNVIFKYFLSVCVLYFQFLTCVFSEQKILILIKFNLSLFPYLCCGLV